MRHTPVTSLAGLVDKHLSAELSSADFDPITGQSDFAAPSRLVEQCLADPAVAATPVCICYSTGTPPTACDAWLVACGVRRAACGVRRVACSYKLVPCSL